MIKQITGNEKIYGLKLSDGTTWGFSAVRSIEPWLDELAGIMQLENTNTGQINQKVFFLAMRKDNKPPTQFPGWNNIKQGAVYRVWFHSKIPEIFIELNPEFINHPEIRIINMWFSLEAVYSFYVDKGSSPAHATLAEYNGKGILIAAAGGVGKSTCLRRLPTPWKPLADDSVLIIKGLNKKFNAHPMPTWIDHLWSPRKSCVNSAYSVPLNSIFFLKQSNEDAVYPLNKSAAIQKTYECFKQVWKNYLARLAKENKKEMVHKLFDIACEVAGNIPCFTLHATLEGKFREKIEEVI